MQFRHFARTRLSALAATFLLITACGDEHDSTEVKTQAVYSSNHARILGFESPTADWTVQRVDNGPIAFAVSSEVTQGSSSAAITNSTSGEFVLRNQVPLDSLGTVGQFIEVDISASAVEGWGEVTFVVKTPTHNIYYGELERAQLAGVATPGEFTRLSFPLGNLASVLSSTYDDLEIELKINGAPGTYLVDRISFGGDAVFDSSGAGGSTGGDGDGGNSSGGGTSTGGGTSSGGSSSGGTNGGGTGAGGGQAATVSEMTIRVPKQTTFNAVALGAQDDQLDIHNAVFVYSGQPDPNLTLSQQAFADSTSVGETFTNIGVGARVGDILSVPFVDLKNFSSIHGNLWAGDGFGVGDGVLFLGGVITDQDLSPYEETTFTYAFPDELVVPPGLPSNGFLQNGTNLTLEPGGYVATTVQSEGTTLSLQGPGAFYFDSLKVESGAELIVDNSDGAVFVIVRDEFRFKGTLTKTEPDQHNFLVAYEGDDFIDPVASFSATFLAPNATVDLPTADHISGAFFGKSVIVHQTTEVWHYPFERTDCESACGLMFGCAGTEPIARCGGQPGDPCEEDEACLGTCGHQNGVHFQKSGQDVCWGDQDIPVDCQNPEQFNENCGDLDDLCGECLDGLCEGDECYCLNPSEPGCGHCYDGAANAGEWQVDCGPTCPNQDCLVPAVDCQGDNDCGPGAICSDIASLALGLEDPTQSVCWNDECASGTTDCGTSGAPCGNCVCQPSCDEKQCGTGRFNGCNGTCTGFCDGGETGCQQDSDCEPDFRCLEDAGDLFGYAPDTSLCVPEECWLPSSVGPGCGYDGATCGLVCGAPPVVACDGMECGQDPRTGAICGLCDPGKICNLQNTCSAPSQNPPIDTEFSVVYDVGAMRGAYATTTTGKAAYSVPLELPPGAGGVEPQLGLSFQDTSNIRGPLGPGWRLTGISRIHRCATPIAQDVLWSVRPQESLPASYCLDGVPLVFNQNLTDSVDQLGVTVFQPAGDPSTKVHFFGLAQYFVMYTADGRVHSYGTTEDSQRRVYWGAEGHTTTAESWYIAETKDRFDNLVEYHYLVDSRENITSAAALLSVIVEALPVGDPPTSAIYPSHILYSPRKGSSEFSRRIAFNYIDKIDPIGRSVGYRNRAPSTDARLLKSIRVDTFDGAFRRDGVRSYYIEYSRIPNSASAGTETDDGLERVSSIRECASAAGSETCLPATTFRYDDYRVDGEPAHRPRFGNERLLTELEDTPPLNVNRDGKNDDIYDISRTIPLDANGDGIKDLLAIVDGFGDEYYLFLKGQLSDDGSFSFADAVSLSVSLAGPPELPIGFGFDFDCTGSASVADLDGDGREEIVDGCPAARGRTHLAFLSVSEEGIFEHLTNKPAFIGGKVHVGDIDGNGRPDFVQETDDYVYFGDFNRYAEGIMRLDFHRVDAVGDVSKSAPLFLDVDGDGVANFLRFSASAGQFYALGFSRDTDADQVQQDQISNLGQNYSVTTLSGTWSPTRLTYEWDPLEKGGLGNRDTVRVLDVNGDGLQDVWMQRSTYRSPWDPDDFSYTVGPFTIIDASLVVGNSNFLAGLAGFGYQAGRSEIWLNQGGTFKLVDATLAYVDGEQPEGDDCVENERGECSLISNQHLFRNSTVLDYDQDGRQELVMVSNEIQARFHVVEETAVSLRFAMTTLDEFSVDAEAFAYEFDFLGNKNLMSSIPNWSDFDGDGNLDMVIDWLGPDIPADDPELGGRLAFYPGRDQGRGRRLVRVKDGLGNRTTIARAPAREVAIMASGCGQDDTESGNKPRCLRLSDSLVKRVTRDTDNGDHFGSTSYQYVLPTSADFIQGYFFQDRITWNESDGVVDGQPEVISGTADSYEMALFQPSARGLPASYYPFLTSPTFRLTELALAPDLEGTPGKRTIREVRDYRFDGYPGKPHMYERVVGTSDDVQGEEEKVSTVTETFSIDGYGLSDGYTRTVHGSGSWPTISEYTVSTHYDSDPERWILDKVETRTVSENRGSFGTTHDTVRFEYDDHTGFVTKATTLSGTARELVTEYWSDSFGNIQQMKSGNRVTQFDYGDSGIYLREVQNAAQHVQSFAYDDALGKVTVHTNETGYRTVQEYDGFGRLVLAKTENGAETVIQSKVVDISWASPTDVDGQSIRSKVRITTESDFYSGETFTEYDSRGLVVRSKMPGLGVGGATPYLFTEQVYDWAGRPIRSSQEHVGSVTSPNWTTISRDKRGRATVVNSPQGTYNYRYASHRQYEDDYPAWAMDDGFELVHVTDPEGLERVTVSDYKGQTVLTADGVNLADADTGFVSKVILGPWDLPRTLIDPELNETVNRYTSDGLLEWSEDLDRGRTEWTYDSFGNVQTELAADGVESLFAFDEIDRLETRTDRLADGDQVTEWRYDEDVFGTLSSTTGPSGITTEFEYESTPRALPIVARYIVDGKEFRSAKEYDSLGRVQRVTYPGIEVDSEVFEFAVRHRYDSHSGREVAVSSDDGSTDYWKVEDVDYVNQNVTQRFGNGVLEERTYDPLTRHLTSIQTHGAGNEALSELGYERYENGQVRKRTLKFDSDNHERVFDYDRAGRLKTVTDDGAQETFGFSPSGRLISRSTLGTYSYAASQPHAVSSVGENDLSYDDRGNQWERNGPDIEGGQQKTTAFSRFNLPERVEVGDSEALEVLNYQYDALGNRVKKSAESANVEVVTPGDLYERTTDSSTNVLHKFRVFAGGSEVLQVHYDSQAGEFTYSYLHRDHLNSVLFTTDEAGNRSPVRDFDVFGAPISDPSWSSAIDESFTGHRADQALGLLQAGVRMYDAKFGVFASPDPLRISGPGSQAFNPFAYANNDPVNWLDPTGFEALSPLEGDEAAIMEKLKAEGNFNQEQWDLNKAAADGTLDLTGEGPIGSTTVSPSDSGTMAPLSAGYESGSLGGTSGGGGGVPKLDGAAFNKAFYGGGSFSNMNIELTSDFQSVGESYPTWDTIGKTLLKALEWGSLAHAATGLIRGGLSAATKLPRFQGLKPSYVENPAHIAGRGLMRGKTPLPRDADRVFKSAVPNDPTNPTAWFGKNAEGQIYRFSTGSDGTAHFSGIHGVGDGTRNITQYALDRLDGL